MAPSTRHDTASPGVASAGTSTPRARTAEPDSSHGTLTVAQGAALSVGAVLGTGVITLPALAAEVAGPASLVAWAALVLLSVPLAATFAALGARLAGHRRRVDLRPARVRRPSSRGRRLVLLLRHPGRGASRVDDGGWLRRRRGRRRPDHHAGGRGRADPRGHRGDERRGSAALRPDPARPWPPLLALLMVATMALALPHGNTDHLSPFAPNGWGRRRPPPPPSSSGGSPAGRPSPPSPPTTATRGGTSRAPRRSPSPSSDCSTSAWPATSLLVLGPATGRSEAPLSDLMAVALGDGARVLTAVVGRAC